MCVSKIYVNKNHVPCRKCWQCSLQRTNEWIFRVKQEVKYSKHSYFMTYQYNEKNVPIYNLTVNQDTGEISKEFARGIQNAKQNFIRTVYYKDMQDYFKRLRLWIWRKNCINPQISKKGIIKPCYKCKGCQKSKDSLKYYAVPEYGDKTQRPHYHAIIITSEDKTTPFLKNLQKLWDTYSDGIPTGIQNGYVHRGDVVHNTIRYVVKYMSKRIKNTPIGADEPKAYISKGLGKSYVDRNRLFHLDTDRRYLVEDGGYKISMPKYYKDKIWNFTRPTKDFLNYLRTEKRWNDYYKLSDYEKFVKNTIEENKVSRAKYEKMERQLCKIY